MKKEKELLLLSHFRNNARLSLTKISRMTKIPVSTIFDKLKEYENNVIKKHTALVDFRKLGYEIKAHLLMKVPKDKRDSFQDFLRKHENVNNVFRINNGYDFLVEGLFRNLKELDRFIEQAEAHGLEDKQEHFVLEEIAREEFLAYKPGFENLIKMHINQ